MVTQLIKVVSSNTCSGHESLNRGVGDIELDSNALKILKSVSLISYMILKHLNRCLKQGKI